MPILAAMRKNDPIGIFDSGVGGLTVARAIRDQLPAEDIVYFGDTAHLPYGDRSPELIRQYSTGITKFLLEKQCKAIIIACNSASANALDAVIETAANNALVFDVISPIASHIATERPDDIVGVIGTKATVNSRSYPRALEALGTSNEVKTMATPLLAPMIEEGFVDDEISTAVLQRYLRRGELKDIDLLVLGCTHYPLIAEGVRKVLGGTNIELIDPPQVVASNVKKALAEKEMLADRELGDQQFYVSDLTPAFARNTELFFGKSASLEALALWEH